MIAADGTSTESVWEIPNSIRLDLLARLTTDPTRPAKISYDDFLEWTTEDTHAEWVDGSIVMTSPASDRHQMLVLFFGTVVSTYTEVHDLGVIRVAPFQMKLAHSGREPDVIFVARDHLDRITRTYLNGPADLVIEITSPESVRRDRGDKFYEYEEAGIPEYWLIDPDREEAVVYRQDANGYYAPIVSGHSGRYESIVLPGFWLEVDWLWQRALPDATSTLLAIDREAYSAYLLKRIEVAR